MVRCDGVRSCARSPSFFSFLPRWKPGALDGTAKMEMPFAPAFIA
jgi:hypothetical protein